MIYEHEINGVKLRTGDIICTHDGGEPILVGQFWRFVGNLVPGDVDHVAIYVGPGGRCVEAGVKGVIAYDVGCNTWDSVKLQDQRGPVADSFYGASFPVEGSGLSEGRKTAVRENVAAYCLAQLGKHYNLNFLNSKTEDSFYCSQLAYVAYLKNGIDLNTDLGVPHVPGSHSIIFPQELWSGCVNKRA